MAALRWGWVMTDRTQRGDGADDPLAVANDLLQRGIMPLPLLPGEKNPIIRDWQHLTITAANAADYFNGANLDVGGRMGPKSGGLVDVDLDCIEAMTLATYFLPPTAAIYGRASKPKSHFLYRSEDAEPKGAIPFKDENNKELVDLKIGGGMKGSQSVMPGSRHPSGELYAWDSSGEPARVPFNTIKDAVTGLAVASLLLRHWPEDSRNEFLSGLAASSPAPVGRRRQYFTLPRSSAGTKAIRIALPSTPKPRWRPPRLTKKVGKRAASRGSRKRSCLRGTMPRAPHLPE